MATRLEKFPTVESLARELEERIPCTLSEPWDHDGRMIVPDRNAAVTGVLCALDCTSGAIEYAASHGYNVIVTHHPLLFKPLGALTDTDSVGKRVLACVRHGIAVLSYHTRLDCLDGGVNDRLAEALGLTNVQAFLPHGRIGEVFPQTFESFRASVSERLQVEEIACVKATDTVNKVAVVSGSGKDEIEEVLRAGADTFVTGEVMHNHMLDCRELGLNLLCATHYATERVVLPFLRELVSACGASAAVYPFVREDAYGI